MPRADAEQVLELTNILNEFVSVLALSRRDC
jgi:hypothetical protein